MRTKEQFKKDFAPELKEGVLIINDEVTEATIFILQDGTIIDAQFDEFNDRCTDHHQVLSDSCYSLDDLVTIEPESQTIILPVNGVTSEQIEALTDIDNVYSVINWLESNNNLENNTIELIQWLYEAGVSIQTIFDIIRSGSFAELDEEEVNDYEPEEKDDLIYTESAIFDVW